MSCIQSSIFCIIVIVLMLLVASTAMCGASIVGGFSRGSCGVVGSSFGVR